MGREGPKESYVEFNSFCAALTLVAARNYSGDRHDSLLFYLLAFQLLLGANLP